MANNYSVNFQSGSNNVNMPQTNNVQSIGINCNTTPQMDPKQLFEARLAQQLADSTTGTANMGLHNWQAARWLRANAKLVNGVVVDDYKDWTRRMYWSNNTLSHLELIKVPKWYHTCMCPDCSRECGRYEPLEEAFYRGHPELRPVAIKVQQPPTQRPMARPHKRVKLQHDRGPAPRASRMSARRSAGQSSTVPGLRANQHSAGGGDVQSDTQAAPPPIQTADPRSTQWATQLPTRATSVPAAEVASLPVSQPTTMPLSTADDSPLAQGPGYQGDFEGGAMTIYVDPALLSLTPPDWLDESRFPELSNLFTTEEMAVINNL